MLLVIALFLLTGIGILFVRHSVENAHDTETIAGVVIAVLSGIVLFVVVLIALIQNLQGPYEAAYLEQIENSLTYQLENDLYDNDNDIGKKELYDQITEYNSRVAAGKTMQHDPWVGILFPSIYDDFELIPME